ncbi:MAG: sulfotransferase [Pseudomonadota bacterium]
MNKPDYIFIGPLKSGTTWIDNYLRSRNDVMLPTVTKETFFFDKVYHNGWEWYSDLYGERKPEHKVCVEVAPSYMYKPEAVERIAKDLPDVKVIATLRNPIDRAVAHYFHHLKGGEPDRGFRWMAENHPSMLKSGLYHHTLTAWVDALGRDRVELIDYDDLNKNAADYVRQICGLLNIDLQIPEDSVLNARINERGHPRYRFLAKAVRHGSAKLRLANAHWLVNTMRNPAVLRFVYGPRPAADKGSKLREEAMDYYYDQFFADFSKLDEEFGFDTSAWRKPEDVVLPSADDATQGAKTAPV